jgi:hypothetical protein
LRFSSHARLLCKILGSYCRSHFLTALIGELFR